ncbi:MAG: L-rhamnose/proton symporter RhaT [Bacteroidales bacterium]|nr:L-rhamnose/proton symporter RhaT [Bacteroidales bacterium]
MVVFIGVLLVLAGGFASGSFYLPFTKVKKWSWESFWLFGGLFSWLIVPIVAALITIPHLMSVYKGVGTMDIIYPIICGFLWGIGGLTFGLSMRYLGMSLGMAIALGLTAAFGTLITPYLPLLPFWTGEEFKPVFSSSAGIITFVGVIVGLIGIGITGKAGMMKDKGTKEEDKKEGVKEFNLKKGLIVALVSGIMNACFAFGIKFGEPITAQAQQMGASSLNVNNATYVLILLGGLLVNAFWCIRLLIKNKTFSDYGNKQTPLSKNYIFSAIAGTIWYLQFFLYGMGESKMGDFGYAGWSILMGSSIIFSNIWGLINKEWKGANKKTIIVLIIGLAVLLLSTAVIGIGASYK